MKLKIAAVLMLVTALGCGSGGNPDGGRIPWKGQGKNGDVKALMAQARKDNQNIMLFFSSEG